MRSFFGISSIVSPAAAAIFPGVFLGMSSGVTFQTLCKEIAEKIDRSPVVILRETPQRSIGEISNGSLEEILRKTATS